MMPWPGNVRELRNVLERACSLWDGMRLTMEAFREVLPEIDAVAVRQEAAGSRAVPGADVEDAAPGGRAIGAPAPASADPTAVGESNDGAATLPERIAALERAAIRDALRATGGNRVQAARRLGIARATLYQKLAEFPELAANGTADRVA
jgi:DNA-binding NtrC family response regulator